MSGLLLEGATVCFSSGTQTIEKVIKIVTDAAMKTCGHEGENAKLQPRKKNSEIRFEEGF